MKTVVEVEAPCGGDIPTEIRSMVAMARARGVEVRSTFNDVPVRADAQSDAELLIRDWRRSDGRGAERFVVGPSALATLPPEEVALDAAFARKAEAARQAFWSEVRRKEALRREALQAALEKAPEFTFVSPEAHSRFEAAHRLNADSAYGERPFSYALEVGRLVQADPRGPTVAALKDAMNLADDGLSGYLDSVARSILRDCWAHGYLILKMAAQASGALGVSDE